MAASKQKEMDVGRQFANGERILRKELGEKESLEAEHCFSQEEREGYVRKLIEENKKLAEIARDKTAKLDVLEQRRLKEVAGLEKEIEQLVTRNAVLEKENEEYSEEVADMRHKIEAMETKLSRRHSVIMELHAREEERELSMTPGGTRCNSEPKRLISHSVSSPSCISEEVFSPEAACFAVTDVLQCKDEEAQYHIKTFFEVMDTSSQHVTYTSGNQHRDWRCLADHVGLHEEDLQATNCKKRLTIIFDEWAKKESVTVAKVHKVLIESQCTRAAGCLLSAARSVVEQEQGEDILGLVDKADYSCSDF